MSSTLNILAAAEKSKRWPQCLAVIFACICSFSVGLNFGWTSPYIPKMLSDDFPVPLDSEDVSYIATICPLGYLIGAPLSAYLANRLGRKPTLLLLAIPQIMAWLILGFSNSFVMYLIGRFIAGIPEVGVFILVPMYIGEISEPKIRGLLGSCFSLSMITGNFCINVLGTYTAIEEGSFLCIIAPILFVALFFWMPESPYYLIMKNDVQTARESLQNLRRMKNVEPELTQLISDVQRQMSESSKFKDLFLESNNLKALLILLGLRAVQQYSGLPAFGIYGQKIFADAGSQLSPSASTLVLIGSQIIMTSVGSLLVDRLGRKPLFLGSCIATCFVLSILSAYFYIKQYHGVELNWLPLAGMVIYIIVFSVGLGVVPNLMMSELLSASIKAKALVVNNLFFGLIYSTATKTYQLLADNYGMYTPFLLYAICCLLGFFFGYYCIPETKGRSLEEIQQKLKTKPKPTMAVIDYK